MKKLTCFVAGAYSSKYGWFGRAYNVIKMATYVRKLVKIGVMPIAPNVIYSLFASHQSREFWLEGTRVLQDKCDVVFFVPGWEVSSGAMEEYVHAIDNNQPKFHSLLSLKDFSEKSDTLVGVYTLGDGRIRPFHVQK